MRGGSGGGGARMLCSPYLTGAAFIMLVIVAFKHWGATDQIAELEERIARISTQSKADQYSIRNLESSGREKDSELKQCRVDKDGAETRLRESQDAYRNKEMEVDIARKEKEAELAELKSLRVQCLEESGKLEARLRDDAEAMAGLKQQIEALQSQKDAAKVAQAPLDIKRVVDNDPIPRPQVAQLQDPAQQQPPPQPAVRPDVQADRDGPEAGLPSR